MMYRVTKTHVLVYLPPYGQKKAGFISSYKLLDRAYKNVEEFIINGKIYECKDYDTFLEFDTNNSDNREKIGVGLSFPDNGLKKMFDLANKLSSNNEKEK